jgi:formylglycine-generating enzyme required for sulfatase activity
MTHPVGGTRPNAFGIFDMHGNAWEWCQDYYASDYPPGEDVAVDPKGPPQNPDFEHVLRGGSWDNPEPSELRSAVRLYHGSGYRYYTFGFRVRRWVNPMAEEPKSP